MTDKNRFLALRGEHDNGSNRMPRAHMPAPLAHAEAAEEAARAAQRYVDLVNHVSDLTRQVDEWRGKAIAAEHEVERFTARERDLMQLIDQRGTETSKELQHLREVIAVLKQEFTTASRIILNAVARINAVEPNAKINPMIDVIGDQLTEAAANIEREAPNENERTDT